MSSDQHYNIILSGIGGQGIVSTGQILAGAAIANDMKVLALEEHGLARRGGSVNMFIRIGDGIFTPLFLEGTGNIIVAFEPYEALRFIKYMNKNGSLILNTYGNLPVSALGSKKGQLPYPEVDEIVNILKNQFNQIIAFSGTELAKKIGNPIVMSMVMLGALAGSKILPIPKKYYRSELKNQLNPTIVNVNLKAFEIGYKKANEFI
jgi:indolepyruvate ferredoxin oxidoreductase beta subunit